jgi:hypothetical protein
MKPLETPLTTFIARRQKNAPPWALFTTKLHFFALYQQKWIIQGGL